MDAKLILEYAMMGECAMSVACLAVMWRKRLLRDMWGLAAFLGVYTLQTLLAISLMFFRRNLGIEAHPAWLTLYYTQWTTLLIEYVLLLIVIYGAFRLAMKPLRGLHRAGKIIFLWVAVVSLLLSLGMAFGPHSTDPGTYRVAVVAERLQQGTSVLLLCMLVFVCFATRYLGLNFRNRIFGILLGLGIYSACSLVESAWISTKAGQTTVFSAVHLVDAFGFIACLMVWGGYLIASEPKRKLVLLPTTSPYFFWNQVSEALGDDPGHVVVSGFTPDMLAPGELQMMKKKSPGTVQPEQQEQPVKVASGD